MKQKIWIIVALIGISVVGVCYDLIVPPKKYEKIVGEKKKNTALDLDPSLWQSVPDVTLRTLDGGVLTFADLRGKVVLLNFWATWCPTCIKDFPGMKKVIDEFNGEVVVVALSNDDDKEAIVKFLKLYEDKYGQELASKYLTICWDEDRKITNNVFNTARFPETIVISKDSKMAQKLIGEVEWDSPEIQSLLAKLLALD